MTCWRRRVGTAHLGVITGAARSPAGDIVLCDVAREAADQVLAELRAARIHETGAITVEDMAVV